MATPVADFLAMLDRVERTRLTVEDLHRRDLLLVTDVEAVYEGLFLRVVTAFEDTLERLFYSYALGKAKLSRHRVSPRLGLSQRAILDEVLLDHGRLDYLDWLPYGRTEKRAQIFLVGGRPFTLLDDRDKGLVLRCLRTRNAIAHPGEFARRQFRQQVVGSQNVLTRERRPAGYLRGLVRTGPPVTRFQTISAGLRTAALKLGST